MEASIKMKKDRINLAVAASLILIAVSLRVLPHPANFAPVAAVAIFSGSVLPRRLSVWTPLLAMMLSDAIIGFHKLIPLTWGCYALTALASNRWLRSPTLKKGT